MTILGLFCDLEKSQNLKPKKINNREMNYFFTESRKINDFQRTTFGYY